MKTVTTPAHHLDIPVNEIEYDAHFIDLLKDEMGPRHAADLESEIVSRLDQDPGIIQFCGNSPGSQIATEYVKNQTAYGHSLASIYGILGQTKFREFCEVVQNGVANNPQAVEEGITNITTETAQQIAKNSPF